MGNQSTLDRPVISHWQKNGTARKFEALIRAEQWATALTGSVADAFPQSTPDLKVIYVALAGGLAGLGRLFGCHANLFSSSRNNLRRNSDGSLRYFTAIQAR
jgi:hypothetical protein